jgi:hypothetical protein
MVFLTLGPNGLNNKRPIKKTNIRREEATLTNKCAHVKKQNKCAKKLTKNNNNNKKIKKQEKMKELKPTPK